MSVMQKLRIQVFKQVVALFCLSLPSFGCSFFPPVYKVPQSFSVHVKNDMGPVTGLKLRVLRFRVEEFEKLSNAQQRVSDPKKFVEVIAESVTDATGTAQFNVARTGQFTLEPEHEASQLDGV